MPSSSTTRSSHSLYSLVFETELRSYILAHFPSSYDHNLILSKTLDYLKAKAGERRYEESIGMPLEAVLAKYGGLPKVPEATSEPTFGDIIPRPIAPTTPTTRANREEWPELAKLKAYIRKLGEGGALKYFRVPPGTARRPWKYESYSQFQLVAPTLGVTGADEHLYKRVYLASTLDILVGKADLAEGDSSETKLEDALTAAAYRVGFDEECLLYSSAREWYFERALRERLDTDREHEEYEKTISEWRKCDEVIFPKMLSEWS